MTAECCRLQKLRPYDHVPVVVEIDGAGSAGAGARREAWTGAPQKTTVWADDSRRVHEGAAEGGRTSAGEAMCDLLIEALKDLNPRKYRQIQVCREHEEERWSERRALVRAVERIEGKHLKKLERILGYGPSGRRQHPARFY